MCEYMCNTSPCRFVHALSLESKIMETTNILCSRIVMDSMELNTSSIHIYREAFSLIPAVSTVEKRYNILEPIEFTAHINRNISQPTELYPNVDIVMAVDTIKVCRSVDNHCRKRLVT